MIVVQWPDRVLNWFQKMIAHKDQFILLRMMVLTPISSSILEIRRSKSTPRYMKVNVRLNLWERIWVNKRTNMHRKRPSLYQRMTRIKMAYYKKDLGAKVVSSSEKCSLTIEGRQLSKIRQFNFTKISWLCTNIPFESYTKRSHIRSIKS